MSKSNILRINMTPVIFSNLYEGVYNNKFTYEIEYDKILPRRDDYPEYTVKINWTAGVPHNIDTVNSAIKKLFKSKLDQSNQEK